MGKEMDEFVALEEERENLLKGCQRLLDDYIDEAPPNIVSAGYSVDEDKDIVDFGRPLVFKYQRNWLTLVVGKAGRIAEFFMDDDEILDRVKKLEEKICGRSKLPVEDDPNTVVDRRGFMCQLTLLEEVDECNDFLRFSIEKLKGYTRVIFTA